MTTLRNFLAVSRRYMAAFGLNVLGLAVALTVAAMVFMQLGYDYGFDPEQRAKENIYLMNLEVEGFGKIALAPRPAVELLKDVPGVEAVTIMDPQSVTSFVRRELPDGREIALKRPFVGVDEGFTEVFNFEFTQVSGEPLRERGTLVIPESMAKEFAPDGDALGMTLRLDGQAFTVNGIYKDFSSNSSLGNLIYLVMEPGKDLDRWSNFNYNLFIRTTPGTDIDAVTDQAWELLHAHLFRDEQIPLESVGENACSFTSLADLHLSTPAFYDLLPKADKGTLFLFLTIAILIVAIACINFTNFNTALSPLRVRSINTMKVLGSSRASLVGSIVGESALVGLVAWALSLGLLLIIKNTPVANLIDAEISFVGQWGVLAVSVGVALLAGVLAGLYPALYLTGFAPALALKGNFALSPKGRRVRSALVALQFLVAFVLLGYIGTIGAQNRYMKNIDVGYQRDNLIIAELEGQFWGEDTDALKQRVRQLAFVQDCGVCNVLLSASDVTSHWGRELRGEEIRFSVVAVDEDFFRTVGVTVTQGREFREGDWNQNGYPFIFNETARRALELTLDDTFDGDPILGFVNDLRISSFRGGISPTAFILDKKGYTHDYFFDKLYIRVAEGTDLTQAKRDVLAVMNEMVPNYPFVVMDNDQVFAQAYATEQKSAMTISVFSILAVLISLVGVFGLVAFDSEARRKEIAVRKVMGARTGDILRSFNRSYLVILGCCFLVAVPLSWYFSAQWLSNFNDHIAMPWWVFVPALLMMVLLVSGTVTAQCWRIASSNPAGSLKAE